MSGDYIPRPLWYSHEHCYWHDPGLGLGYLPVGPDIQPLREHGVDPDLRRAEGLVRANGVLDAFEARLPRPATDEELQLVHTVAYIAHIEAVAAAGGGEAGVYAPTNYHSARAARLAAGACIQAVQETLTGTCRRSYCLIRPPGHHADRNRAMALCLYNNVALAASAALQQGSQRVLVLDWDVHHGNGIQSIFYEEPRVLYISVHQDGLFPPGSGQVQDIGRGAGRGTTINVPLPPGSGEGAYLAVIERIVIPAARRFEPDLILVAAGLDASAHDPMGRQLCTTQTFHTMTTQLCYLADEVCDGRIVFAHEGGYSTWYLPLLVQAVATAILGRALYPDPFLHSLEHLPGQILQSHQARCIEQVIDLHRDFCQ